MLSASTAAGFCLPAAPAARPTRVAASPISVAPAPALLARINAPALLACIKAASAPFVAAVAAACVAFPMASLASAFACGVAVGMLAGPIATGFLERYYTAEEISSALFKKRRSVSGLVVKVADGDTFRVAHLPPMSLLRRGSSRLCKPMGGQAKLSESTLQVRIAAVDCPETAKFGSSGQDFGDAATEFVQAQIEGKRVRIKLLARDQYQRCVATVTYRRNLLFRRNLSEELLRRGLATVYRQGGAEYDGSVERWDTIEAEAKKRRRGLWAAGSKAVDPAAYKRKLKNQ